MLPKIIRRGAACAFAVAVCAAAAGCQQYQVEVRVDPGGGGERTVTLDLAEAASDTLAHLMALDVGDWTASTAKDADGADRYLYRRRTAVSDLGGWPAAGGLLVRGEASGKVRLAVDVGVEQVRGTGGAHFVYRETLHWENLREEVAAQAADAFAAWLEDRRPALPASVVAEQRGVVAAAVVMRWADIGKVDGEAADRFADDLLALVEDRLRRAGIPAEQAAAIRREAKDFDLMSGMETALPGLDQALQTGYELKVTMPGRVTGGNADEVDGRTATWRVDLTRSIAAPLVLTVESGG